MLVSGAVIGLIAGLALRRDWRPLERLEIRALPFLFIALFARVLGLVVPGFGLSLEVLAIATIGLGALVNWRIAGMAIIALGSGLNLLVIVLNQGMPVGSDALLSAGAEFPRDPLHVAMVSSTILPALGDIIPLSPLRGVYSVGDLVIALGGFVVPFRALLRT
jgi:hypothetical protein